MFHCDEVKDPFMLLWAEHICYNVICSCIRIKGEVSFKQKWFIMPPVIYLLTIPGDVEGEGAGGGGGGLCCSSSLCICGNLYFV